MLLFCDMLNMLVRYASPSGPMCLRCLMLTLSGPVELLFLLCFIATWTCVVVSVMLVVCSLSVGEVSVFSLKVMVCVVVLLASPCIVFQREYVCCVCDPSLCLGVPSILCQICVFV